MRPCRNEKCWYLAHSNPAAALPEPLPEKHWEYCCGACHHRHGFKNWLISGHGPACQRNWQADAHEHGYGPPQAPAVGPTGAVKQEPLEDPASATAATGAVKQEPPATRAVKEEPLDEPASATHGPFSKQEVERSGRHGGRCWRPCDGHTGLAKVPSEAEDWIRLEQGRLDQERRVLDQERRDQWVPPRSAKVELDHHERVSHERDHGGGGDGQVGPTQVADPDAGHSQDEAASGATKEEPLDEPASETAAPASATAASVAVGYARQRLQRAAQALQRAAVRAGPLAPAGQPSQSAFAAAAANLDAEGARQYQDLERRQEEARQELVAADRKARADLLRAGAQARLDLAEDLANKRQRLSNSAASAASFDGVDTF